MIWPEFNDPCCSGTREFEDSTTSFELHSLQRCNKFLVFCGGCVDYCLITAYFSTGKVQNMI